VNEKAIGSQPAGERLVNPVKEKLRAGEAALGIPVRITRAPDVARIAKSTGHDFIFIDGQHAVFDLETTAAICQTALAIGVAPLVRVRGVDDPNASLLLDNGAAGIIYPDVATAADARKAVDRCKFPPLGKRSVAGAYPHFDYRALPLSETMQQLNEHCLLVCMIETVEGLRNVESIAAVKGVDVIHLGSNDLLTDMGKPGQFDDPDIIAAQERVINAARDNGIYAGCGGIRDVQRQVRAIKSGARFVTTQTDVGFLAAAAGQWTSAVRTALTK
jgi:2-keto-3-deoxy-L-rhamnonate aldolase RhmA